MDAGGKGAKGSGPARSDEWQESPEDTAGRRKEWLSGRLTLLGALPRAQDAVYLLFCVAMVAVLYCAAAGVGGVDRVSLAGLAAAQWVAALVASARLCSALRSWS